MSYKEDIKNSILKIIEHKTKPILSLCMVNSVNINDLTCSVTSNIDGSQSSIPNVHLSSNKNDGIKCIPAIDSTILVMYNSVNREYYMILNEDLLSYTIVSNGPHNVNASNYNVTAQHTVQVSATTTQFNQGQNLGLVKVTELVDKIVRLESAVQSMFNALLLWTPNTPPTLADITSLEASIIASTVYINCMEPFTVVDDLQNKDVIH